MSAAQPMSASLQRRPECCVAANDEKCHGGGLGQVNSAGRDVAESLAQAYVFNVFGWLAEAARG